MKHSTSHQYDVRYRESPPKLEKVKTGTLLMCPFCPNPHPLWPDKVANCGTTIVVKAVQTVIPAKRAKRDKLMCLKCHQVGEGEMVKFMNGFIHLEDCNPGTIVMVEPPPYSKLARLAFGMGEKNPLRKMIENRNGRAEEVHEIDEDGKKTGKILGHVFYKEQVKHGENPGAGA